MPWANGRLQLRCATLDVNTLSERELCVYVLALHGQTKLLGSTLGERDERDDLMNTVVLINSQTLTDPGRDLLRQIVGDHLERVRRQQANDLESEERTQRKTYSPPPKARPDLGVTLASIGDRPSTNE